MAAASARAEQSRVQPHGIVFYLDGAGGGGLFLNWGREIKRGLRDGGYLGEFEDYDWQTGLGPLVDHALSEEQKRVSARKLAREIESYMATRPGEPVHIIGLSAGTAVLVYALEELPADRQVDNVVLLSSSLDAQHDLTRALRRVRGKMYTYTSKYDPILNSVVPMMGTADREFRVRDIAGLQGFAVPANATADTRQLYGKVVHVPWRTEFARYGNFGSHTGATNASFVQRHIAPLLKPAKSPATRPAPPQAQTIWPWPRAGR